MSTEVLSSCGTPIFILAAAHNPIFLCLKRKKKNQRLSITLAIQSYPAPIVAYLDMQTHTTCLISARHHMLDEPKLNPAIGMKVRIYSSNINTVYTGQISYQNLTIGPQELTAHRPTSYCHTRHTPTSLGLHLQHFCTCSLLCTCVLTSGTKACSCSCLGGAQSGGCAMEPSCAQQLWAAKALRLGPRCTHARKTTT